MNVPYRQKGLHFSMYVLQLLNNLLGRYLPFPLQVHDIDKSHPLYQKNDGSWVIIVRLVRRDVRDAIFYKSIKVLPDHPSGIVITENLTAENTRLLNSAKNVLGEENIHTDQGKIYSTRSKGKRVLIQKESDVAAILDKSISIPIDEHDQPATNDVGQDQATEAPSLRPGSENDSSCPQLLKTIKQRENQTVPMPHLQQRKNYYQNNNEGRGNHYKPSWGYKNNNHNVRGHYLTRGYRGRNTHRFRGRGLYQHGGVYQYH